MIAGRLIRLLKSQQLWKNQSCRLSLCQCHRFLSTSTIEMGHNANSLTSNISSPVTPRTMPEDTDLLTNQLQQAQTAERILKLASLHHEVMNNTHLTTAFEMLFRCLKNSRMNAEDIISKPAFRSLCNQTMKRIRFFHSSDVIRIFKTLGFIGVPSTAAIMQGLCQMLRHSINELSLQEIAFLDYILSRQQSTPLVDALLIALPLVLEAQLECQLDNRDLKELTSCLIMATRRNLKYSVVENLSKYILRQKGELVVSDALSVMKSLANYRPLDANIGHLLRACQGILAENLQMLSEKQILAILFEERLPDAGRLFHKDLLGGLAQRAVIEHWQLWKLFKLLSFLNKCEMVVPNFLDLLAQDIASTPNDLEMDDRLSVYTLAAGFGIPGYQAQLGEMVHNAILQCDNKSRYLLKLSPLLFLRYVKHLVVMQWCPNSLLSLALDHSFVSNLVGLEADKDRKLQVFQDFLSLEQYARQQAVDYTGPYLPKDVLRDALNALVNSKTGVTFPLRPHLEIALGGNQFLKTAMWTQYGQFIDHVVVMRKGNFPVAIHSHSDHMSQAMGFLEDLPVPQDAVVVAILVAERQHYCQEPPVLKGHVKADLAILKKQGYHPLLINLENWYELLDHEKIPYLMREMKDVTDEATRGRDVTPLGM